MDSLLRGMIRLRSDDPEDKPVITPNYLTDPHGKDLETLVRGVRFVRKVRVWLWNKPYVLKPNPD